MRTQLYNLTCLKTYIREPWLNKEMLLMLQLSGFELLQSSKARLTRDGAIETVAVAVSFGIFFVTLENDGDQKKQINQHICVQP